MMLVNKSPRAGYPTDQWDKTHIDVEHPPFLNHVPIAICHMFGKPRAASPSYIHLKLRLGPCDRQVRSSSHEPPKAQPVWKQSFEFVPWLHWIAADGQLGVMNLRLYDQKNILQWCNSSLVRCK
jgi:hypothetical protein